MKVLTENYIEQIKTGDAEKALKAIDMIIEKLEAADEELRNEILNPEIITNLHELLIEHIGVAPRAMQLNRRFPNAGVRALMFARAMRNGITHAIKVADAEAEKAETAQGSAETTSTVNKVTFVKAQK